MSNEFHFRPEVAELYGVNEAIYLHSLSFWLDKNRSNRMHFHNGRYWSYDTHKAIAARFSFWTVRQIERIVASCEMQGAILVDNFNTDKTNRTKWYTLAGDAEKIYLPETVVSNPPDGGITGPQEIDGNLPDGEMGKKDSAPFTQTGNCIKETVTRTGSIPPKSPKGDGDVLFDRFWKAYPNHVNKEKARRAWKKLKPSLALCRTMAAALTVQKASDAWTKDGGQFIPHAATWLNGKRWEDELEASATPPSDAGGGGEKWGWGA